MKKIDRSKCYGCEDKIPPRQGYCYRDTPNGINEDVTICWRCLLKHVEKHYGLCAIAKNIRRQYAHELTKNPIPKPTE